MRAHAEGYVLNRRIVAILAAIGLLTVSAVAGPLATPASAATYTVTTAEEFYDAIDAANVASEGGTIYLDNDIVFSSTDVPSTLTTSFYTIIDGRGHTVSCGAGPCENWLTVELGAADAELALVAVTVTGFSRALAVIESDLTVVNVTFEGNGLESAGTLEEGGAAIYAFNDTPPADAVDGDSLHDVHLSNVYFIDNVLRGTDGGALGGAVHVVGDITIDNGSFVGNEVAMADAEFGSALGGGLVIIGGQGQVNGTLFSGNSAQSADPGGSDPEDLAVGGGAVALLEAFVEFNNADFTDNSTDGIGGALLAAGAGVVVDGGELQGNSAEEGGAVMAVDSEVGLYGVLLKDNFAANSGGAAMAYESVLDVEYADIRDNTAEDGYGGGIEYASSEGDIISTLFAGNTAETGGAFEVFQSDVEVSTSTLTDNTAQSGAAFQVEDAFVSALRLTVARNTIANPDGGATSQIGIVSDGIVDLAQSVVVEPLGGATNCWLSDVDSLDSEGYNVVDDTSCDLDESSDLEGSSVDAMLGPLQFNGGPTWTMLPAPESALVDAVTGFACDVDLWDQRDVEGPRGAGCDIGAVETFPVIEFMVDTPGGPVAVRILNGEDAPAPTVHPIASLTPAAPAGVNFPYGALGLEIDVYDDGWPVDIEMGTTSPTNQLWKLMWEEWSEYPSTTEQQEEWYVWKFRLIDGADGDEDGDENSTIIDPIALGAAAAFTG